MNPWLGIVVVLAGLGLFMRLLSIAQDRLGLHPEVSRKAVHVGMGLATFTFPWIFRDIWPVVLLGGLAAAFLLIVRLWPPAAARFGQVLRRVERASLGEIYFPIAVATVFALARGDAFLFCIPILILTLADAVGALIGTRYGLSRFQTDDGEKSLEGSLSFFLVAFFSVHVPLLLFTGVGRAEVLLVAVITGFVVMLMEAIAWRGLDNLFIPITAFLLLRSYPSLTVGELVARLVVMTTVTAFAILWRRRTTLSDSAALASAVFGYILWFAGGWKWVVAPLILFAIYAQLSPVKGNKISGGSVRAVIRVMAGPFLWLTLALWQHREDLIYLYWITFAAHLVHITISRLWDPETPRLPVVNLAGCAMASWLVMLLPYAVVMRLNEGAVEQTLFAILPVALSGLIFNFTLRYSRENAPTWIVWLREAALAPAVAMIGLLI